LEKNKGNTVSDHHVKTPRGLYGKKSGVTCEKGKVRKPRRGKRRVFVVKTTDKEKKKGKNPNKKKGSAKKLLQVRGGSGRARSGEKHRGGSASLGGCFVKGGHPNGRKEMGGTRKRGKWRYIGVNSVNYYTKKNHRGWSQRREDGWGGPFYYRSKGIAEVLGGKKSSWKKDESRIG